MKRKTFKTFVGMLLSACFMFSGTLAAFAQESELTPFALNSVTVGAYYQMGTYLDEPILWRCIAYDDKGPLMLSDRILAIKPFDAGGTNTSGSHNRGSFGYDAVGYYRQKYGSNYWGDSNIKDWLNSDADAGNVVWSCGNSPDAEHCWNNYLPYDNEAGFLNEFTDNEKKLIKTVNQKQILDKNEYSTEDAENYHIFHAERDGYYTVSPIDHLLQNYDSAYCEYSDDKVFLLDVKQAYELYKNFGDYLAAEPTEKAVKHVRENSGTIYAYVHEWSYFLRTPSNHMNGSNEVRTVRQRSDSTETFNIYEDQAYDYSGIRPAFYLDTNKAYVLSGSGLASDPYVLYDGILGDVNSDSVVDAKDSALILQHISGVTTIEGESLSLGDVNKDKTIDAKDASLILQYVVGNSKKS